MLALQTDMKRLLLVALNTVSPAYNSLPERVVRPVEGLVRPGVHLAITGATK